MLYQITAAGTEIDVAAEQTKGPAKNARRVLGLDPALRKSGWGIVDFIGERQVHVAHGVIAPSVKGSDGERLATIYDSLEALILAYRPGEFAVEDAYVNKNPSTSLKLGLARGVALLAPARHGLPTTVYAPRMVKRVLTSNGNAEKDEVAAIVEERLGIEVDGFDAADALAVALCHVLNKGDAEDPAKKRRREKAALQAEQRTQVATPAGDD
jgi:crossover junction endodeoxyribonuclease RuvC